MELHKLLQEFLEYLEIERNVSKLTIRNYRHYLERFLAFLSGSPPLSTVKSVKSVRSEAKSFEVRQQADEGGKSVSREAGSGFAGKSLSNKEITPDSIREFRLYLSRYVDEHGISLKRVTQNYHLIALRSFLKYMIKRDIPVVSPDKIDLPKAESRSLKFLEREQVERLMNMPDMSKKEGLRDKTILEVLFSTGLRVSELVNLNRDSINLERREFGVIGKGRRSRLVFLSEGAVLWLDKYLKHRDDDSKALFIRYSGKTPEENDKNGESLRLTSRSVQRLVEKYVKKAKLPIKITPHGLRHSFATDLLSSGADLRAIQEMLGHKNVSTTQIYTHITNPQLKEIHDKFHRK